MREQHDMRFDPSGSPLQAIAVDASGVIARARDASRLDQALFAEVPQVARPRVSRTIVAVA